MNSIEAINFDEDLVLPSEIDGSALPNNFVNAKQFTLFFTGATGFLGTFITHEILKRNDINKIILLYRTKKSKEAMLENLKLIARENWNEKNLEKLEFVLGDLSEVKFGLSDQQYEEIAKKCDLILHNGALVHWVFGYDELFKPNVQSTIEVLKVILPYL